MRGRFVRLEAPQIQSLRAHLRHNNELLSRPEWLALDAPQRERSLKRHNESIKARLKFNGIEV